MIALLLVQAFLLGEVFPQQNTKDCHTKCKDLYAPVCGNDGVTYSSLCLLKRTACLQNTEVKVLCGGECPCNTDSATKTVRNVIKIDRKTARKLTNAGEFQLDKGNEIKDGDILQFEILEDRDADQPPDEIRNARIIGYDEFHQKRSGRCPNEQLENLPARLIDWFHVLKLNKKAKLMKVQGIEGEEVVKKVSFVDAKLKSMYARLACEPQIDGEIEKAVCLPPVHWMFSELDSNNDEQLSESELAEIEYIQNEECIKPFLQKCDRNNDAQVTLAEFCSCLCISPPCTKAIQDIPTILIRGEPAPVGRFTPTCDEDGFFIPKQCNIENQCWCVDRNGDEIKGTRNKKDLNCDNSWVNHVLGENLIPLDMNSENKPRE